MVDLNNETIVKNYIDEGFNKGNVEFAKKLFSIDFIGHNPTRKKYSRSDWVQSVKRLRTTFPDYHITIEDIFSKEDKVVWRWKMNGTDLGGNNGNPPTGNEVEMYGINIERLEEGKIVETWTSSDHSPMINALNS